VEYFFYGRDRLGIGGLRWELAEEHWSFMDRYAGSIIARGPTLVIGSDLEMTGSVHIVDLPDAHSAELFAYQEPYFQAGVFEEVLIRRWDNSLQRTMWDFVGAGGRRFLVIGHGVTGSTSRRSELRQRQIEYLGESGFSGGLIVCGPLLSDDGTEWMGTALMAELADRSVVESMMANGPYAEESLYERVEIHDWRFGGRPTT
jgi:uncharacterized protein YciI